MSVPDEVDLHKPMMDEVKLTSECGGTMTRVPDVIDCWFDSGSMPYAQWHYPFENQDEFEKKYPADFISEAVDQTRGWFYSLLAISTLLFDKPPFKNVVIFEHVLDKEGKKMSKSRGNVIDPFATADSFGADPVRWYLISTSNPWLPIRFDLDALAEVVRKYFDTLRNTYSFFAIYANIDRVAEFAKRLILDDKPFVLDLSGVSSFTPQSVRLLFEIDGMCDSAGVEWALVAGDVVGRRLRARDNDVIFPVVASVAEAEHEFDDAILNRRRFLLPLLSKTA